MFFVLSSVLYATSCFNGLLSDRTGSAFSAPESMELKPSLPFQFAIFLSFFSPQGMAGAYFISQFISQMIFAKYPT